MFDESTIVVTRHKALVDYLVSTGTITPDTPVFTHAPEDVRDRHVIGALPFHLAAEAKLVSIISLALTPEMRGKELTLEEVREIVGYMKHYKVQAVIMPRY